MIWAQWTALILCTIHLCRAIANSGKPKSDTRWEPSDVFAGFISLGLMICAGTFSHIFGWPR